MLTYHVRIGYLELTSFTQGSGDEVKAQVRKALARPRPGAHSRPARERRRTARGGRQRGQPVHPRRHDRLHRRTQPAPPGLRRPGRCARRPRSPMVVLVDKRHRLGGRDRHRRAAGPRPGQGRRAPTPTARASFRRSSRCPTAARSTSRSGEYFTPSGRNLGGGGVRQGAGITPNVYALDNPQHDPRRSADLAERTVGGRSPVSASRRGRAAARAARAAADAGGRGPRRRARASREVHRRRAVLRPGSAARRHARRARVGRRSRRSCAQEAGRGDGGGRRAVGRRRSAARTSRAT